MDNLQLSQLRREYSLSTLDESAVPAHPIELLSLWLDDVASFGIHDPSAFVLSTVNMKSQPFQRVVLMKGLEQETNSLVFYTNYTSAKAKQIAQNPHVSVLFPWYMFERQVSGLGLVEKVSQEESKAYFYSRPKESQIAALASKQSSVISAKDELTQRYQRLLKEYETCPVPFPDFWGGFRIKLNRIEFWQGGEHRLHDRLCYELTEQNWSITRLSP